MHVMFRIKKYESEMAITGMAFIPDLVEIGWLVQYVLGGIHTHGHVYRKGPKRLL